MGITDKLLMAIEEDTRKAYFDTQHVLISGNVKIRRESIYSSRPLLSCTVEEARKIITGK